jgi:hypothetical protein
MGSSKDLKLKQTLQKILDSIFTTTGFIAGYGLTPPWDWVNPTWTDGGIAIRSMSFIIES